MKSYLPIIASLFLLSTSCSSSTVQIETKENTSKTEISEREREPIATEIDPYIKDIKDNIAPEISVKISSADNGGSGVIIARKDNTYLVLTNKHVLRDESKFTIDTYDGVAHQATEVENGIDTDDDLALLQFTSDKEYQTATINTAAVPQAEQAILAVGYSAETGKLVTETGKIERVADKPFKEGYQIGYTSNIVQGMSGGAILNTNGEVIGINSKSAFPVFNTGYSHADGTKPSAEEIEQLRQLSWGLTVNRLLAQIEQEIITAYDLPLPKITSSIKSPELADWLGELEDKAKQISVRIDSSSGANGSGVVIAKKGNTYAVLTADHVLCEKDDDRKCIDYIYEVVAPDGKKYQVNIDKVTRQEGVDLAVLRFDSDEQYQVAELANYPLTSDDTVFVAGYPQLNKNTPAQWLFSLGYGLDREQGLLNINDDSLSIDNSDLIRSQGSLSGGYEMVYTSITYGGMSGGAVLDKDGRVIGIHGLVEGQTAIDSQNSSVKQVQMGYSLGIPINTFIGLTNRLKIDSALSIQDNRPKKLNPAEIETLQTATLGADISEDNAIAENWLERGNQLWRLTRYNEAVKAFDRAIVLNPEFVYLAHYGKGLALWYEGENEAAVASLELATETKPNFASAFFNKSSVLREVNRLDEALVAIEEAIELQKDNASLYNQKGVILIDLKRLDKAKVALSQAIQLNPRSAFYANRSIVHFEQGKLDLAFADCNQALEINPENAAAHYIRAVSYQDQGKFKSALSDYSRAIEINPENAYAYYNRGLIYQEKERFKLALSDYSNAIEINPDHADAHYNRGFVYYQQKKFKLALFDYNSALKISPDYAEVYGNIGLLYEKMGDTKAAISNVRKAQQLFIIQNNTTGVEKTASLLKRIDDRQQRKRLRSLRYHNLLMIFNPSNEKVLLDRGFIYQSQGEDESAISDYNRVIQINPDNSAAYRNRGVLYFKQSQYELAETNWNKAISINPEDALAYYNRGLLHKKLSDSSLARTDIRIAKKLAVLQENTYLVKQATTLLEQLSPDRIHVLLFNVGKSNEGIHTVESGETDTVLMFESSETAENYAKELKSQNFPIPQIEFMSTAEVKSFCQESGYICKLVHTGSKIKPPKENTERFR